MKKLQILISFIILATNLYSIQPSIAASEMDKGLALFNKHDYKNALGYFMHATQNNPQDYNALYYQAVTLHQLGKIDQAKSAYNKIIKTFPGSPAAFNANAALMYIDPVYAKQHRTAPVGQSRPTAFSDVGNRTREQVLGEPMADLSSLPDQCSVPYQKEGNNLVISVSVNGRPIDMFFDSGAESVVISKSVLESLGIRAPSGQHVGMSYGVGDGGGQKTWIARVSVRVGQIERKNFPLNVQEDPPGGSISHPLLGQSFFRDFSYALEPSVDGSRGRILFQKRSSSKSFAVGDSSVIPYQNYGKDLLVVAEINGHKLQMIYDTGAEMCVFTRRQYEALGSNIPDDAVQGIDQGIAGPTTSYRFTAPQIRLGPIIKNDVPISVIGDSGTSIPHPLLGNSFIGDLRVDIDNQAHLIRLRR